MEKYILFNIKLHVDKVTGLSIGPLESSDSLFPQTEF